MKAPGVQASSYKLNFAVDHTNGGVWSNKRRDWITQELAAQPLTISDASTQLQDASLEVEGFTRHRLSVDGASWSDPQWIADYYQPMVADLVCRLTGAKFARGMEDVSLIRDTSRSDQAPAAQFVHLDLTREPSAAMVRMVAKKYPELKFTTARIFNVWRALSLPPQDVPLAVCDQRSVDEEDWVIGVTKDPGVPDFPYVTSVYNASQRWYYYSDLTPDDVVIFKGYDSDLSKPIGCFHGAFRRVELGDLGVPRISFETRMVAFYD